MDEVEPIIYTVKKCHLEDWALIGQGHWSRI
jgi:hypothetical protein